MGKRLKFTDQLRQAVLNAEQSREQICRETGIDQGNMSRFTRGESGLSLAAIDRLCEYLGIQIVESKPKRTK